MPGVLGSYRRLARLGPADLKAIDHWLGEMPPEVWAILDGEDA